MKVGLIQLCSTLLPEDNLSKIKKFLEEAKKEKVEAVFLPEVYYSMPIGMERPSHLVKKGNAHFDQIKKLSQEFSIAILGGSVCYEGDKGEVLNRSLNFDKNGNDLGFYDKINLFRCNLPEKKVDEGELFVEGKTPRLIDCGPLKIGLSICFDLRFPRLYQDYRDQGANLLSISSAFTVPTGKAGHWSILVRARAIENQCFVVACNQWGPNNEKTETWGHSMIVNPWGEVLADAGEGEKLIFAELNLEEVELMRKRVVLKK